VTFYNNVVVYINVTFYNNVVVYINVTFNNNAVVYINFKKTPYEMKCSYYII